MKTFTLYLFSILLFLISQPTVSAAVITVTNTNNSGAGSLRQAITTAASGDEIVFSSTINGSIIYLDSVLYIEKDLTITGNGVENTIIDGDQKDRVFIITDGNSVSMSGLIVQNGRVIQNHAVGGGIIANGNLTMTNCWVRGNSVIWQMIPYNTYGGGIRSSGDLVLINCIVSGNYALTRGGGIYWSSGDLTLINTTVAGNYAEMDAGGINFGGGSFYDFTMRNSIVWANEASQDMQVLGDFDIVTNSIVQDMDLSSQGSGNLDGTNPANDPNFIIGYKVNIPNTGGDYRIMANSNLIDAGNNAHNSTSSDIFDVDRTFDGDLNGTATIDIGAVEFNNYPGLFITQWDTRNPGTSAYNQITIPTFGFSSYNYTVHWGDGSSTTTSSSAPLTHTYAFAPQLPIYNVVIEGTFPRILFNDGGDKEKILAVLNWGDNPWVNMRNAFTGCSNLKIETPFSPNFNSMTDMSWMFQNATSVNENFENWNVGNITNMAGTFDGTTGFNGDIGDWDVSSVNTFSVMFRDATAFNRDIGDWNTESGIGMGSMFQGATSFNRDIGNWNVGNVEIFHRMFESSTAFNQDIGDWDVSSATSFAYMFRNATSFDQDLGDWDISSLSSGSGSLTGCKFMFEGAELSVANYDNLLIGWNRLDPGESNIPLGVEFHGGSSQYCAGEGAHLNLENARSWTFTDGGSLVTYATINAETCGSYTVPSGDETYNMSGTYIDTIPNTIGCDSILTINLTADEEPPIANCMDITVSLDTNGMYTLTPQEIDNGSFDSCSAVSLSIDPSTLDCTDLGSTPVVLTVTDENGNSSTCTANVEVVDDITPTALCQDISIGLDVNGMATIQASDIDNGSFDNCEIATMDIDITSFDCGDIGVQTVTFTVVDSSGNSTSCMANVTIEDNIAPTVSCGLDRTLNTSTNGNCAADAGYYGSYTLGDNCPDHIQVREVFTNELGDTIRDQIFNLSAGTVSPFFAWPVGENTATIIPIDASGNTGSSCSYQVTVHDVEAPVANCQDITIQLNEQGVVDLKQYSIGDVNGRLSLQNSGDPNLTTDCDCPEDYVAVGYEGFAGCIIDEFRLICKELLPDGSLGNTTAVTCFSSSGSSVNETHEMTGDQVLVGFEVSDVDYSFTSARILSEVKGVGKSISQITNIEDNSTQNTMLSSIAGSGCYSSNEQTSTQYAPAGHVIVGMSVTIAGGYTPSVRFRYAPVSNTLAVENGSTDNCEISNATLSPSGFDCDDVGGHSVVYTVWDRSGNSSSCSAVITVEDNIPPVASCQDATIYLDENGVAVISADDIDNGSTDSCGIDTISLNKTSFDCSEAGQNTVVLTVTDINGNSSNCTATVTVVDTVSPMAVCQDITVNLDENGTVMVPAVDVDRESTDNCEVTNWILDQDTFDCSNLGSNPVVLTVTDQSGNSSTCSASITVVDNTPPTPICQDVTISLHANGSASLTATEVDGGSFDNCSVSTISIDNTSFSCADLGDQTVVLTVTDQSGNSASCNATVTVEDNIAPTVSCTGDVSFNTSSNGSGDCTGFLGLTGGYTLDDNCPDLIQAREIFINELGDTLRNIVFDLYGNTWFPIAMWPAGTNTATIIPIDASGNAGTACSYQVTVVDDEAPVANCQDITVQLNEQGVVDLNQYSIGDVNGRLPLQNSGDPNLTTDCDCPEDYVAVGYEGFAGCIVDEFRLICKELMPDGSLGNTTAVTCFSSSGSSVNETHELTGDQVLVGFEVSDVDYSFTSARILSEVKGIGKSISQITNIEDNNTQNTMLSSIAGSGCYSSNEQTSTEYAPAGHVIVGMSVSAAGGYTPSVRFRYAPVTNTLAIDNGSTDNCEITNATLSPSDFDCEDVGGHTAVYTVWDRFGNSSSCSAIITVEDNVPPVALCRDATIFLDENGTAGITAVEIDNGSTDSCGIDTISLDKMSFDCSEAGQNTVVLTVTDVNGNSASCNATVTVLDTISPMANCRDITVELDANGEVDIMPSDIDNGSFDNCEIGSMDTDINGFDCQDVGPNTVILTVTDESGNTNSCTATVTVEDNVPPTTICRAITIELDENGEASIQASDIDNGSFDNCEIDTLVLDITSFDCDDVGPNTVTMTATDVNGNTATCQTIVTVEDNIPPTALCRDITIELNENGEAAIQPTELDNGSFDNCEIDYLELDQTTFDCSHVGQNTVQLTVWDVNGNSQSCNATVTVEDNIPPVVLSVPADITLECDIPIPGDEPIAEDNCEVIITHEDAIIPGNCAGEYVVRRTFTITDPSGNEAAFKPVREIQFIDTKVPYLISAPSDQTLVCGTTPPLTLPVVEDNCDPSPIITWEDTYQEDPSCPQGGRIDRVFTISDDCGNSYKLLQQFYFYDDLDPVITPLHPDLVGLPNGGTLQYQCYAQDPNWDLIEFDLDDFAISDNCSGDIEENLMEVVIGNGDCPGDGYLAKTKYTVVADDGCGNTSSFEFYVELVDEVAPELVGVPEDLTLSCDEEYNYPTLSGCSEVGDVYATDECECAEVTEVRDTIGSGCDLEYSVIITYLATDNCGNTTTASYTITVEDNSAPEVYSTIPELEGLSSGISLDINCNGAHFPTWAQNIGPETFQAIDNCGQSTLIDFSENVEGYEDCFDHGALASLQYKWRFEDECGNEISHEIELRLVDTSAPEIIMAQAHVCANQEVVYPEVMDNCGEVVSLDYLDQQIIDACSGESVIERTWTAIDHCGNVGTAVQTVINSRNLVYDFTIERLSGVEDGDTITIECSDLEKLHPSVNWLSLERDCFEGGEVLSYKEQQGAIDSQCTQGVIRMLEWVWTVRTICHDIQEIHVFVQAEDLTGPILIDFEDEIELTCGEERPAYAAMDFCSPTNKVEEVSFDWIEGDSCEDQRFERVLLASDLCGNETTYTQSVIINTTEGPEISGLPASVCDENDLENVRAYDYCAEMEVPVSFTDVMTENCGEGIRTLRVYKAESLCGTISMDSVYIIGGDVEAPEYELMGELLQDQQDGNIIEVQCDGNLSLRDLPLQDSDILFIDACDPDLQISFSDRMENGNCNIDTYLERRILEWRAMDACGNQSRFRIEFQLVDTVAPQFGFVQEEVVVSCGEQGNIDKVIAYDNCSGGVELTYEDGMPRSTERGTEIERTWTTIDACGNTNSITQILIYEDAGIECEISLPEIITCHENIRISARVNGGTGPYSYNWTVTKGYGEILQGQGTANIVLDVAYSNTELTLLVQDQNGCISSCEAFFICFLKKDRDISRESDKLEYHLYQNSPNPFSDKTTIGFNVPEQTEASIRIFSAEGKQLHQIKGAYEAGYNEVELRRDELPASGMYFYELSAGDFRGVKRMIILE